MPLGATQSRDSSQPDPVPTLTGTPEQGSATGCGTLLDTGTQQAAYW